tara:strand:+ start:3779 stop:7735 length:3957 start_codon:yes stop_codon:yes gene_type:complete
MDTYSIYDPVNEIEEERRAHGRSYGQITGEQTFIERMLSATALDTGVGQLVQSLIYRFELDPNIPNQVDNYNPMRDPQIEGLDDHVNEFITSTSPRETALRIKMLQKNLQRRAQLKNHGFARFMGNVLDPINIIPIPIARGLGFAQGFRKGAVATAAPFAISETARAQIDPTNPALEPYFAITGGALFGGALGGLVGSIPMRNIERIGNGWFAHNDHLDAYIKLKEDYGEDVAQGLKPHVRKAEGESNFDHLKNIVAKSSRETTAEYEVRLQAIADDDDTYNQFVAASKQWDPDEILPTGTKLEKLRISELPYLLLKNNKFEGHLGNLLRQAADRISGPPGLITRGAATGEQKQMQGVYNKARIHSKLLGDVTNRLYDAYLKSLGKSSVDELTPGQRVIEGFRELTPGRARSHNEFKREVVETYLNPKSRDTADKNVLEGANALRTYFKEMERLGLESGVFGVNRILNEVKSLEQGIVRSEDFIDRFLRGDPESPHDNFRLGLLGRIKRDERILADLSRKEIDAGFRLKSIQEAASGKGLTRKQLKEMQRLEKGLLTEKQQKYKKELRERLEANKLQLAEIERWRSDPDSFKDVDLKDIMNRGVGVVVGRTRKASRLRSLAEEMRKQEIDVAQKVDPDAMGYWSRQWNYEAIRKNREEFLAILEKHYAKDGGELARAESTIARILSEMDTVSLKQFMRAEMRKIDVPEEQIAAMEFKVDQISRRKRANKETIAEHKRKQIADLKKLSDDYMKSYGFGDDVNVKVAEKMREIERAASSGNDADFGAAVSTYSRKIDLPSHLFMQKSDGSGPSIDFLEIDPERLIRRYHQRMASSIEMANEFGDPTMRNFIDEIEDMVELEAAMAKTPEEGAAILQEGQRMVQSMTDLSQKVLGIYRVPADPSALSNRTIRVVKNFMVLSLMGKAAIAALADMGRTAMSVGLKNSFEGAFNKMGAAASEFRRAGHMVEEAGEGWEVATHARFEGIFDIDGYIFESTPFERMVEGGVNKMFILNCLAPYTDAMKRFSGSIIQSEMARLSVKWAGEAKFVSRDGEMVIEGAAGKLSRDEIFLLTRSGIGFEEAVLITRQFEKHGDKGDALYLSNVSDWDDPVVQKTFRTALVTEINNAVITPGPAERPNFMGTGIGSLMFQFKSFAFSATQRTLMAGLQQRDAKAFHGILSMVAMGYMVDFIKSPSYDNRDFTSLDRLVQAVDYSGATGILFDLNNMLEVTSGNSWGVRPLLGVDSFFKDPNLAQRSGQVGGPVASLGLDFMNNLFDPETAGSDWARSARRLIPFNNLIWWSWAVDRLQRSAGEFIDDEGED